MLRLTLGRGLNLTENLSITEWIGINSAFSQAIRWKRKPIWLPPAKSKLFRLPTRYKHPPEQDTEIRRIFNNYKTYRTAIKLHLMRAVAENRVQFDEEVIRKAEEEDYKRCLEINDQWNKEVKQIRDKRVEKEQAEERIKIIEDLTKKEERERKYLEEIENQVRKAKIESATFITRDNIDQAIEEALANIVNYNAAIDAEGNTYQGDYIDESKIRDEKTSAMN